MRSWDPTRPPHNECWVACAVKQREGWSHFFPPTPFEGRWQWAMSRSRGQCSPACPSHLGPSLATAYIHAYIGISVYFMHSIACPFLILSLTHVPWLHPDFRLHTATCHSLAAIPTAFLFCCWKERKKESVVGEAIVSPLLAVFCYYLNCRLEEQIATAMLSSVDCVGCFLLSNLKTLYKASARMT